MTINGYLGIDESNHGRFPAIFVGVYSNLPTDVLQHDLNKVRGSANFEEVLGCREYRYVYIPKEFRSHFDYEDLKVIGWTELIKAFPEARQVIIDGVASKRHRRLLSRLLDEEPPCSFEMKADITYPLVHCADAIALRLFRYYKRWKSATSDGTKYHDNIIIPELQAYRLLFKSRKPVKSTKRSKRSYTPREQNGKCHQAAMDEEIMEHCAPLSQKKKKIGKQCKPTQHLKQCFISKKKKVVMY